MINIEEKIGKTVGRRVVKDGFALGMGLQKLVNQLNKSFGNPGFPKGVFRFRSFEEADAWTMKYLTAKKPD